MYIVDPVSGWIEPWGIGRCTKPGCECDEGQPMCWVCVDEWAAMLSDAEVHPEPDDSDVDPWLDEIRDPTVDDDIMFDRAAQIEETSDA